MDKIYTSATKLVLLAMTAGFIGLTFIGKIEPKDFVGAMMMILAFYFGQKSNPSPIQ